MLNYYSFLSIIPELKEQFGIEAEDSDQIIGYALAGYNKIGNATIQLKLLKTGTLKDSHGNFFIQLPCHTMSVEAVCLPFVKGKEISSTNNLLFYETYNIENWIELFKANRSNFYLPGSFVKYTLLGDKLYFTLEYKELDILYKELLLDPETDLPMLTQDELDALVLYCAYSVDLKRGRVLKDQATLSIALMEKELWNKACSKARVRYLNQNEMNEVLDVLSSWGGTHSHGVTSDKPIP